MVDWNGNDVVSAVAAECPNTIVITNSGGVNVLPFADNENVTAILAAHWGGEQQGNSIADVRLTPKTLPLPSLRAGISD
jgi:beta-glucosidase